MSLVSLYDEASLWMSPSGSKDGKIHSEKPTDGSGDFTFSRGSNLAATRVGADGLIEKGRENILLHSNQFDTTWVKASSNVTSGQLGYDGSSDAWLLEKTGAYGRIEQSVSLSSVQTLSVYLKLENPTLINGVQLRADTTSGVVTSSINLETETITSSNNDIDSKIVNVGNGWYRCSVTHSFADIIIRIYPSLNGQTSLSSGSIYIQDAQLEIGLAATNYIETGATTGKAGLLEDEPRLDYSGGATCPSLLLEPSRTNIVNSMLFNDFNGATYILSSTKIGEGMPMQHFTKTAIGQYPGHIITGQSISSGDVISFSMFFKPISAQNNYHKILMSIQDQDSAIYYDYSRDGFFDDLSGTPLPSNKYVEEYANGVYRIVHIQTSTASANRINLNIDAYYNTTSQCLCGYAQVELDATYPTSYIPNHSGGSVTRGADAAYIQSASSLIGQTEGTFFVDFEYLDGQSGVNENWFALESDSGGDRILFYKGSTTNQRILITANGSNVYTNTSLFALSAGTRYKLAVRYDSGDIAVYLNGSRIVTNTSTYTRTANLNNVTFNESAQPLSSRFNQMLVFPTGLTDSELTELTINGVKEDLITAYKKRATTLEEGASERLDTYLQSLEDFIII